MPGSALTEASLGLIKAVKRHRSTRGHSYDHLVLVEKLEEEINDLNKKLDQEASQARILTNKVRHLRHFSELLDAPDAFRKTLDVLGKSYEENGLEDSQQLLHLQSMLARIGTTEIMAEPASVEEMDDITSSGSDKLCTKFSVDKGAVLCLDLAAEVNLKVSPGKEVSENSIPQSAVQKPLFPVINTDPKKETSLTTIGSKMVLTGSGIEDVNSALISSFGHCNNIESLITQAIGSPDSSIADSMEAAKNQAAFHAMQSHPISPKQLCSLISENNSSPESCLEVQSCPDIKGAARSPYKQCGFSNYHQKEEHTPMSRGPKFDTPDYSYDDSSDLSSCILTAVTNRMDCKPLVKEEPDYVYAYEILQEQRPFEDMTCGSESSCVTDSKSEGSTHEKIRNLCFEDVCSSVGIQVKYAPLRENCELEICAQSHSSFGSCLPDSKSKVDPQYGRVEHISEEIPNRTLHKSCSLESKIKMTMVETNIKGLTIVADSFKSCNSDISPGTVHISPPSQKASQLKGSCSVEPQSRQFCVDFHALELSRDTPARVASYPSSQAETPSPLCSQGSCPTSTEDRPILGTVAAHWNHSSSLNKKWWDGKGIPNSTNKYKEDQKVSWHATPFEVRLERALANQGRIFQKKLFTGPMSEMEVST
ncbi:hypothetical protein KP509_09G029400 [Ceratopteris richardii]|nr:hypothetical protein KP509_09G029400 [Ceratopteris richardii]